MRRRDLMLLTMGLVMLSSYNVFAISIDDIYDHVLRTEESRYVGSRGFSRYLVKNGVQGDLYRKYLVELNSYRNTYESDWESVENGSIILDYIIFLDDDIRKEYNRSLKKLGSVSLAYIDVKRGMLNKPELIKSKYKSIIRDEEKVVSSYVKRFGRKPTKLEIKWMSSTDTLKYAMYGGVIGSEISSLEKEWIDEGEGYKVLGLMKEDIKDYIGFMGDREIFDVLNVRYKRSNIDFESIALEISSVYKVDIFEEVNESEMLAIHSKSLNGLQFDEEVAKKHILNLLVDKDIISKEDIEEDIYIPNKKPITDDKGTHSPKNELLATLKGDKWSKSKNQDINSLYDISGGILLASDLSPEFIHLKYGDINVNTYVRMTKDGKLTTLMFDELIAFIDDTLKMKSIFSDIEMLNYINKEMFISEIDAKAEFIEYEKLKESFKAMDIELYKKEITNEINIADANEQKEDVEKKKLYELAVNTKDKVFVVQLGQSKELSIENVKTLLLMLDYEIIVSDHSIVLFKDNEMKLSKAIGLKDTKISYEQLKELLIDINEDINIMVREVGYR